MAKRGTTRNKITIDTIVYLFTLPLVTIIVMYSFRNVIPDLIDYVAQNLMWLFP